ncbi:hypothetical protein RHGRI_024002 [Rhododendron griersonianum]|uniref:Uncharacterized protein n=1 Tax=Rhododendron griersonianum TaxID=479676 RepID=A0AAV6JAY3_9ERIC|nr:hypothetical protein RHGRI_024002 [Rhododendron griersonianum]
MRSYSKLILKIIILILVIKLLRTKIVVHWRCLILILVSRRRFWSATLVKVNWCSKT